MLSDPLVKAMEANQPVEMDPEDRDAFLGTGGTGVIALSAPEDESPRAVPVSYGYDPKDAVFYFRLAKGTKGELLNRPVTFVVYGNDDRWRSVVARGRLEDVEAEGIATESLDGLDRVDIPLVDIFHAPLREVEFEFYRLDPDELSARVEANR